MSLQDAARQLEQVDEMLTKLAAVPVPRSLKEAAAAKSHDAAVTALAGKQYGGEEKHADSLQVIALARALKVVAGMEEELIDLQVMGPVAAAGNFAWLKVRAGLGALKAFASFAEKWSAAGYPEVGLREMEDAAEIALQEFGAIVTVKKIARDLEKVRRALGEAKGDMRRAAFPQVQGRRVWTKKRTRT